MAATRAGATTATEKDYGRSGADVVVRQQHATDYPRGTVVAVDMLNGVNDRLR
jgi:hypothetical protein